MALYLPTNDPAGLFSAFKKAIDDGHIVTWSYKANGDLVHTPAQWKDKAVMRPSTATLMLQFGIVGARGVVTNAIYGVLHGRLIEEFLTHFNNKLEDHDSNSAACRGVG